MPTEEQFKEARKQLGIICKTYINHFNDEVRGLKENDAGRKLIDKIWLTSQQKSYDSKSAELGLVNSLITANDKDKDINKLHNALLFDQWFETNMAFINNRYGIDNKDLIQSSFMLMQNKGEGREIHILKNLQTLLDKMIKYPPFNEGNVFEKSPINDKDPIFIQIDSVLNDINKAWSIIEKSDLEKRDAKDTSTEEKKQIDEKIDVQGGCIKQLHSTLKGYVKSQAMFKLYDTIDPKLLGASTPASKLVNNFADKLNNEKIAEILKDEKRSRRSKVERGLKIASVATILIGVGLVPTLILAGKRLIDTNMTSVNFFKPLSKSLHEDAVDQLKQVGIKPARK